MKNIITFTIEKGSNGYFVASAANFPIVTQAKSLDKLTTNIHEATELYFESVTSAKAGISKTPSLFLNFEMPIKLYA